MGGVTHSLVLFTSLLLLGIIVSAVPIEGDDEVHSSHFLNVIYWGQNGGNTIEDNDLSMYCVPTAGIDIIVLAFLYGYGNGNTIASGTIGQSCSILPNGESVQCENLAAAIKKCQENGVKVLLSLGGAMGAYSLSSQQEAGAIGQHLWDAYGNTKNDFVHRPFGATFVNGWDFDIEASRGNEFYQHLICTLRSNFNSDLSNEYYITGAPQCPIPEPNMQHIITNSQFDYLWVQFYNNPSCSVNGAINFESWVTNIAGTASADAKILIGLPASPYAATGTYDGAQYYLQPNALATLLREYVGHSALGGVMLWSAGFSEYNIDNGCNYAQQVRKILNSGSPC
ncbi:chitinase 2 [Penicillium canariense]|uniref:Chitinase 2 n=1 Tax=Penicillium canariense TaxID=189055 RepID=A0A9W9I2Q1_9EURO|nr:chitinase 2 [Penicillium canariense]KAJ5160960.1 chitinase 2 [Penicillium canariense]